MPAASGALKLPMVTCEREPSTCQIDVGIWICAACGRFWPQMLIRVDGPFWLIAPGRCQQQCMRQEDSQDTSHHWPLQTQQQMWWYFPQTKSPGSSSVSRTFTTIVAGWHQLDWRSPGLQLGNEFQAHSMWQTRQYSTLYRSFLILNQTNVVCTRCLSQVFPKLSQESACDATAMVIGHSRQATFVHHLLEMILPK